MKIRLNEENCAVTSYSYIVSYEDLFGSTKRSIRWFDWITCTCLYGYLQHIEC